MKKIIFLMVLSVFSMNLYANNDWAGKYSGYFICNIKKAEKIIKNNENVKVKLEYYDATKNMKIISDVFEDVGGYLGLDATNAKDKYRVIVGKGYIIFDVSTGVLEIKSIDTKKTEAKILITDCVDINDLY